MHLSEGTVAMATTPDIRVALSGRAGAAREGVRRALEDQGLTPVAVTDMPALLKQDTLDGTDVLLVDLQDAGDDDLDVLPTLMERSSLPPVLFNEGMPDAVRGARLAAKLLELASGDAPESSAEPTRHTPRYWVLGASFGGPEAVKRFLEALPEPPDAAFVLAQHIGAGFVDLLAAQLARSTVLEAVTLRTGMRLRPGTVAVMPVDHTLRLDEQGCAILEPTVGAATRQSYSPCVDDVITAVSERFGSAAGAIIFSGMGADGAEGSRRLVAAGGQAWGQDAASCAISSMPDAADAATLLSRRGTPEALAQALIDELRAGALAG